MINKQTEHTEQVDTGMLIALNYFRNIHVLTFDLIIYFIKGTISLSLRLHDLPLDCFEGLFLSYFV